MTSFSFTLLVSQRRLVLREVLLLRDNVDKGWGKRGLSACRYIPTDVGSQA
jgi:hypothetical protein